MRWFRFVVLVVIASVAQTGGSDLVSAVNPNARPDLLLMLLVFFATQSDGRDAVIASFALGLAADLANPAATFMGPKIISFGLLGTLLSELNGVLSVRRRSHQAIAIFVVGVFACLLSYGLARVKTTEATSALNGELFWQPLVSGIIGPFLFRPVEWWMQMTKRRRRNVR